MFIIFFVVFLFVFMYNCLIWALLTLPLATHTHIEMYVRILILKLFEVGCCCFNRHTERTVEFHTLVSLIPLFVMPLCYFLSYSGLTSQGRQHRRCICCSCSLDVDDSLCVLYHLRVRGWTRCLLGTHSLCCIHMYPELYDVLEDMCAVSVVVLIKVLVFHS